MWGSKERYRICRWSQCSCCNHAFHVVPVIEDMLILFLNDEVDWHHMLVVGFCESHDWWGLTYLSRSFYNEWQSVFFCFPLSQILVYFSFQHWVLFCNTAAKILLFSLFSRHFNWYFHIFPHFLRLHIHIFPCWLEPFITFFHVFQNYFSHFSRLFASQFINVKTFVIFSYIAYI